MRESQVLTLCTNVKDIDQHRLFVTEPKLRAIAHRPQPRIF